MDSLKGYDSLINSLAKHSKDSINWVKYFPLVLWVDYISVRKSTEYSAFKSVYSWNCLLPTNFMLESYSTVDWEGEVKMHKDLLIVWMR